MKIILYKNNSDPNRLDKQLDELITMNGYLRDGSNLIMPSIKIEYTGLFYIFNYCYIEEFGRYYFIRDINIEYNKIINLSLSVDVLMSFNSQIKNLTGIVSRNEFDYNLYLNDPNIQSYCIPKLYTLEFNGHQFSDHLENLLLVSGGYVNNVPKPAPPPNRPV